MLSVFAIMQQGKKSPALPFPDITGRPSNAQKSIASNPPQLGTLKRKYSSKRNHPSQLNSKWAESWFEFPNFLAKLLTANPLRWEECVLSTIISASVNPHCYLDYYDPSTITQTPPGSNELCGCPSPNFEGWRWGCWPLHAHAFEWDNGVSLHYTPSSKESWRAHSFRYPIPQFLTTLQ